MSGVRRVRVTDELVAQIIESPQAGHYPNITTDAPADLKVVGGQRDDLYPCTSVLLVSSASFTPDPTLPFVTFHYVRHWGPE